MMNTKYLLALHSLRNMNAVRLKNLMDFYEHDAEKAWHDTANWHQVEGFSVNSVGLIAAFMDKVKIADLYEHYINSYAGMMVLTDDNYPALLKSIYDPPYLFFYYGALPSPAEITIAMIGTRSATTYGKQVARVLARDVAAQGIWVVSGMARGLDSICHRGALEAGGKTIAVLGSGLDVIYPPENDQLYRQIIENGAVISEWPFGAAPDKGHFPVRNRIISGLSKGVVVIEAGTRSGTLLTVDRAMEQNRDVFTVPGPITSAKSKGTNALLSQGAKPVGCAEDIWREYLPEAKAVAFATQEGEIDNNDDERVLRLLSNEPIHFDQVAGKLEIMPQKLAAMMTMLEIKGLVKQLPGKYYIKAINRI
ncbi:MAG: DNA-processing protein DprA [Bacillota bacterium]|jgi:DNA processing protein